FDLNIGVLYILAMASLGVYGIVLAGWSSNSKYSLLGGLRASAQMISYELAAGLAIVCVFMASQSLSLQAIVADQGGLFGWYIFRNPFMFVAGVIFFICSLLRSTVRRSTCRKQRQSLFQDSVLNIQV